MLRFESAELALGLAEFRAGGQHNLEIQPRSRFLWSRGIERALEELLAFVRVLANGEPFDLWPSRVDVAVDTQGITFPDVDDPRWVTRAVHRQSYREHSRRTGIVFGRGKRLIRIYDKSLEIKRSGKDWMWPIWLSSGAERDVSVTRIELQARRDALREVGIDRLRAPNDLAGRLDALFEDATTRWLRFHLSARTTRCDKDPVDPAWEIISRVSFAPGIDGAAIESVPIDVEQHVKAMRGHLVRVAAHRGVETLDEALELACSEIRRCERGARRSFRVQVAEI